MPSDTRSTIERGAYFATRAKKGLKIISLNTNFCNTQNWWVLLNATDPGQQLEWLIQQLTESERLGEMVCLPDRNIDNVYQMFWFCFFYGSHRFRLLDMYHQVQMIALRYGV